MHATSVDTLLPCSGVLRADGCGHTRVGESLRILQAWVGDEPGLSPVPLTPTHPPGHSWSDLPPAQCLAWSQPGVSPPPSSLAQELRDLTSVLLFSLLASLEAASMRG